MRRRHPDGGDGACVTDGTCSPGLKDGGDGACVGDGECSPGFHDGGDFVCIAEGNCSAGLHDGGEGTCIQEGQCLTDFHDGGDGRCLSGEECSAGFHLDRTGTDPSSWQCVPPCTDGTHDCGTGGCFSQPGFCCFDYEDLDGTCVPLCAEGFHRSGGLACIPENTCSAGFHDGRGVVDNSATCPNPPPCTSAQIDIPELPQNCPSTAFDRHYYCVRDDTCWFSDNGAVPDCGTITDCLADGTPETICECGQHVEQCGTRPSFADTMYFPGQAGGVSGAPGGICVDNCVQNVLTCVPDGTCSPGFHDGGSGSCVPD